MKMRSVHYVLVYLVSLMFLCVAHEQPFIELPEEFTFRGPTYDQPYRIAPTVAIARSALAQQESHSYKDTLAVMIMFNYPLQANGSHPRMGSLVCALNNVYTNVAVNTPVDVFVWVNATAIPLIPTWFQELFPRVVVMPIDEQSWLKPEGLSEMSQWTYGHIFSLNYHLMGRWRMTFAFDFVRAMGYEYMLQIDDDTFVLQPINFNIVQDFRSRRIAYAIRNRIVREEAVVVLGLPELVKYWMVTRNYLTPAGPLFENVFSGDLSGVNGEGWNRHIASASFMLFDVGFWFEPPVQNFLQLVYSTGGDLMQRWLEQEVMNMLHLLFLPEERVHRFRQGIAVHYKARDPAVFQLLQCDPGVPGKALSLHGLEDVTVLSKGTARTATVEASTGADTGADAGREAESSAGGSVRTIQFLVLWEVHGVGQDTEELALFRWRYDPARCGQDAAEANNYKQYVSAYTRGDEILRIFPNKWFEYGMDERLAAMMAPESAEGAQMDAQQCRDSITEQLRRFVEFFCIGMGTEYETRLQQICNGMWNSAQAYLNAQLEGA